MHKKFKLCDCIKKAIDSWLNPIELTETDHLRFVDGFKYQVVEEFVIIIEDFKPSYDIIDEFCEFYTDGTLVIKKGFAWDGASGPTFDTKDSHIPAIVHDAFYRFIRKGFLDISVKSIADDLFYKMLRNNGMCFLRAFRWYLGVHFLGWKSCTEPTRIINVIHKNS